MDKELFEELEANLIRALELARSAQTSHTKVIPKDDEATVLDHSDD